jgi:toxin ParE1/3/4
VSSRYLVRPKADQDIEDQAFYYATEGNAELGHRFLVAAHETFATLATHPEIGWHPRLKHPSLQNVRVFRVAGFERILILYRPLQHGVDILRVVHGSRNVMALLRREGLE